MATATEQKDGKEKEDPLADERAKLTALREKISLLRGPITATTLFVQYTAQFAAVRLAWLLRKPVVWLVIVPLIGLWFALKHVLAPELFRPPVCGGKDGGMLWQVELAAIEAIWWLTLGILSSIGFGTGLHSGLMFLFPHVMQVVGAAEACHTTTGLVSWYNHPCKLDCSTTSGPKDDSTVTFWRLLSLVTVQCMLWGIGTAVGEIPPYAVARTARLSGSTDSEFQAELEDAKSKSDIFSRLKVWTIHFTEKRGFMGVFLLAAWPNAAFDMCGMCCGYLLMPFWTFFLATALGKGVVKVNAQAVFFIHIFGSGFFHILAAGLDSLDGSLKGILGKDMHLQAFVTGVRAKLLQQFQLQSRLSPERLFHGQEGDLDLADLQKLYGKYDGSDVIAKRVLHHWDKNKSGEISLDELREAASRTDGMVSLGSLDPGAGTSILKMAWELFIVGLVLFFAVSIINQLARLKQQELDEARLEELARELEEKGKGKKDTKEGEKIKKEEKKEK